MLKTIDAGVTLVAHDAGSSRRRRRCWSSNAAVRLLPGRLACLAARAGGARPAPGEGGRTAGRAARPARALRRAVPGEGLEGAPGAVEAKANRPAAGEPRARARPAQAHARLRVPETGPLGTRRGRRRGSPHPRRRQAAARRCRVRDRARRARRARRAERPQDDALETLPASATRRAGRSPRSRRAWLYFSQHEAELDSVARCSTRQCGHRPQTAGGAVAPRAISALRLGRARSRSSRSRAASGGWRSRSSWRRARTSSSSRADEPPRPRVARVAGGGARSVSGWCCSCHDAPCSTRSRTDCSRSRTTIVSYPGGWADYARAKHRTPRHQSRSR